MPLLSRGGCVEALGAPTPAPPASINVLASLPRQALPSLLLHIGFFFSLLEGGAEGRDSFMATVSISKI